MIDTKITTSEAIYGNLSILDFDSSLNSINLQLFL